MLEGVALVVKTNHVLTSTLPETFPDGLLLLPHQLIFAFTEPLGLAITFPVPIILLKLSVNVPVLYMLPPLTVAELFKILQPVTVNIPALFIAPPLPVTSPFVRVKLDIVTVVPLFILNILPAPLAFMIVELAPIPQYSCCWIL